MAEQPVEQLVNAHYVPLSYLDDDQTLTQNSDTRVATQKATKAYIDTHPGGGGSGTVTGVTGTAPIVASASHTVPAISIMPASGSVPGSMSAAHYTKLNALSATPAVTAVTGTAPIVSSGGLTPAISINPASQSLPGTLSAVDKIKLDATTGTNTGDQDLSSYALSSGLVHTTGNETIAGVKTFSSVPLIPAQSFAPTKLNFTSTALTEAATLVLPIGSISSSAASGTLAEIQFGAGTPSSAQAPIVIRLQVTSGPQSIIIPTCVRLGTVGSVAAIVLANGSHILSWEYDAGQYWLADTSTNVFNTIAVSGQSNVVADATSDTLTFVAGANMTITTNASTDTITFVSSAGAGGAGVLPSRFEARLTTVSGSPFPTSDQVGVGTIYVTPFQGSHVSLYTSSAWVDYTLTQVSLVLSVVSGKNYDVFLWYNAGTMTVELSAAWTNDSTRADALALQDGVLVKSSSHDRRYVGTIRASGTNMTEDSAGGVTTQIGGKRFVWNYYNRGRYDMRVIDTTDSWVYKTQTWRQANGAAGNKVEFVCGDVTEVQTNLLANVTLSTLTQVARSGIGADSITAPTGVVAACHQAGASIERRAAVTFHYGRFAAGYHYLAWLELGAASNICTWIGDEGSDYQSGMVSVLFN